MSTIKTILLGTSLLLSVVACSQVSIGTVDPASVDGGQTTTEEEYNYLTKGYPVQVASGLGMKQGYSLVDMGNSAIELPDGRGVTEFKALVREGHVAPCAILMTYRNAGGAVTYCCIPSPNADPALWQRTMQQVHEAASALPSSGMDAAIIVGLMHLSARLAMP